MASGAGKCYAGKQGHRGRMFWRQGGGVSGCGRVERSGSSLRVVVAEEDSAAD